MADAAVFVLVPLFEVGVELLLQNHLSGQQIRFRVWFRVQGLGQSSLFVVFVFVSHFFEVGIELASWHGVGIELALSWH